MYVRYTDRIGRQVDLLELLSRDESCSSLTEILIAHPALNCWFRPVSSSKM